MKHFTKLYNDKILGAMNGWDRIRSGYDTLASEHKRAGCISWNTRYTVERFWELGKRDHEENTGCLCTASEIVWDPDDVSSYTANRQGSVGDICSRVKKKGQAYRAITPWAIEDFIMLQFISQGQVQINGFRNKDLRSYLFADSIDPSDKSQVRKASGRVTRRIRLLRGHGLVKKAPKTNRYLLTAKGKKVVNAILAASAADTQQLMELTA